MKLRWLVQIDIEDTWVADGFEITEERMKDIIEEALHKAAIHKLQTEDVGDD